MTGSKLVASPLLRPVAEHSTSSTALDALGAETLFCTILFQQRIVKTIIYQDRLRTDQGKLQDTYRFSQGRTCAVRKPRAMDGQCTGQRQ
eukprot:COSAG06_NODE_2935_length_6066_cov_74.847495_4_plen_90_part_00